MTDAFAQSNTERLAEIDKNAGVIQDIVNGLEQMIRSLSDNVESILTMIASMVAKLNIVGASVVDMSDAVAALNDKTSQLETSVKDADNIMVDVQDTVDSLSSSIDSFDDIQTNIALLTARIDSLETTLADGDIINHIIANTNNIDELRAQITAADASMTTALNDIQNRLASITTNLDVVSEKVDRPAVTSSLTADAFKEYSEDKKVSTYDFARLGKKVDERGYTYYDLELSFVCNEDVRLKSATAIQAVAERSQYLNRGAIYGDSTVTNPNPFPGTDNYPELGVNYVRIQGTSIYHNWYQISPTTQIEFNHDADFASRLLKAGDAVPFHARLYDGMFIVKNNTSNAALDTAGNIVTDSEINPYLYKIVDDRNTPYRSETDGGGSTIVDSTVEIHEDHLVQLVEKDRTKSKDLYTIRVAWVSTTSNTQCSTSFGSEGHTATYTKDISHVFIANIIDPDEVLRKFDNTLDCAGDPVRIGDIEATPTPSSEWDDEFSDYADLYLTIQDGKGDDTPDAEYELTKEGEVILLEGDDYLEFRDADLRIHGQLPPGIEGLIISLDIDSVENARCITR